MQRAYYYYYHMIFLFIHFMVELRWTVTTNHASSAYIYTEAGIFCLSRFLIIKQVYKTKK